MTAASKRIARSIVSWAGFVGLGTLRRNSRTSTERLPPIVSAAPARPWHAAVTASIHAVSTGHVSVARVSPYHGIQSAERFGFGLDADGDGFVNELTRADVTAVSLFQAAMAVPGRVIPDDPDVERAVRAGEARFAAIGCTSCHIPALPLTAEGWIYTEPNPFNPPGCRRLLTSSCTTLPTVLWTPIASPSNTNRT